LVESGEKLFINPLVEEGNVVLVVLHDVADTVLAVVLSSVHKVILVTEDHLWLNHPELSQVP